MAEREGFEPPEPCSITGFQDQRHQPLGHPSAYATDSLFEALNYYSKWDGTCQYVYEKNMASQIYLSQK